MNTSERREVTSPDAPSIDQEDPEPSRFWTRLKNFFLPRSNQQNEQAGGNELGASNLSLTRDGNHGTANLLRLRVADVYISKSEITSVPNTIERDELINVFRESGFTRLPVYEGNLDSPVGLVHLKDVALKFGFEDATSAFNIEELLRPLLYVPPAMPIGKLLAQMQADRKHMALVIDEYGGVDGVVTIEDLIEQVIGQIEDEHDTIEGKFWSCEPDGQYVVLAKMSLEDFEAETGVDLGDNDIVLREEIDTLGGMVVMLAGRVPARGEVLRHPTGLEFEVLDADLRRIKRLRVCLAPMATAAE